MIIVKIWAVTYGIVILGWLLYATGMFFLVASIWEKGRKVKIIAGLFLVSMAVGVFVFLSASMDWQEIARLGALL